MAKLERWGCLAVSLHTRADSTLDLLHSASSHFAHPIDCARAISHQKTTHTHHTACRLLTFSSQTCQCRIPSQKKKQDHLSRRQKGHFAPFLWWGRSLKEPQESSESCQPHTRIAL